MLARMSFAQSYPFDVMHRSKTSMNAATAVAAPERRVAGSRVCQANRRDSHLLSPRNFLSPLTVKVSLIEKSPAEAPRAV